MYDELVKRLRDISNSDSNIKSNYIGLTMIQAADAIEELQQIVEHYKGCSDDWYREACDYKAMLPRWIPVTERLPKCEKGTEVGNIEWINCGMVFAGCFGRGGKYRDAYFRTWTDATEGIDAKDADYWRPCQIPESPKEET